MWVWEGIGRCAAAIVSILSAMLATSPMAGAQDYPAKAIRLVVPYPPGGGTDLVSRVLAQTITANAKWSFVIENKPGAGGAIGVEQAARSAADGYTIVMGQTSNLALAPSLNRKLPYDPLKDLQPITLVASGPLILVVSSASKYKSLADLVAGAKAEPGRVLFGSPGNGSLGHPGGELFLLSAGIRMEHIPYKGAAQAITDVLGGRLDVFVSTVPAALPQVRSDRLRALAVLATEPHADLPGVPSAEQAGMKGLEVANWYGLLVPAATPKAIVVRLAEEVSRALGNADLKAKYAAEGVTPSGNTADAFGALIASEIVKWEKAIKASGLKLE
jgi:tripartite-type tricarboxylate transporter receptor subunit TctC